MITNKKRADAGYLELMISLIISLALGIALITGSKGIMRGIEGVNLTHQLHNELTTQAVNAPFQRGYDTDNLVKIYFDYDSINLYVTQKKQITYALKGPDDCDKTVTWNSLNTDVAFVDNNGIVTGVSPGDTVVYATTATRVRAKCSVHVDPQVKIIINPSSFDLYIGNTRKISYTTDPVNPINSSIKWKSSNSSIAAVDSTGNVKGISKGTVTIIGTTYTGNTAACIVHVKQNYYSWNTQYLVDYSRHKVASIDTQSKCSLKSSFYYRRSIEGDKNVSNPTAHAYFKFQTPLYLSKGSYLRLFVQKNNISQIYIYINGKEINDDFTYNQDIINHYDGNNNPRTIEYSYLIHSGITVNTIEIKEVGRSITSRQSCSFAADLFITPLDGKTFLLNNNNTSINENYNHVYYIGSYQKTSRHGYYDNSVGSNYIHSGSHHCKTDVSYHFTAPESLKSLLLSGYISKTGKRVSASMETSIKISLTDWKGKESSYSYSYRGLGKINFTYLVSHYNNDTKHITDVHITAYSDEPQSSLTIYPIINFIDGTVTSLGKNSWI